MQTRWKVVHHLGIRLADGPTSASAHLEFVLPQNVTFRAEVPKYHDILSGDPNGATATGPGWRMGAKPERFPPSARRPTELPTPQQRVPAGEAGPGGGRRPCQNALL